MKKFILMAATALLLVGCDQQGGSTDNYGTSTGGDTNTQQTSPNTGNQGQSQGQGAGSQNP